MPLPPPLCPKAKSVGVWPLEGRHLDILPRGVLKSGPRSASSVPGNFVPTWALRARVWTTSAPLPASRFATQHGSRTAREWEASKPALSQNSAPMCTICCPNSAPGALTWEHISERPPLRTLGRPGRSRSSTPLQNLPKLSPLGGARLGLRCRRAGTARVMAKHRRYREDART